MMEIQALLQDGLLSIGELARRAGATVKTVRFYSDRGLLPEAVRSSGGHRRYGPEALERLRLIRSLRALDLPVSRVVRVLDREDSLDDVVAGQLSEVGSHLAGLRWREAALRLLQDCTVEQRAERLRLIEAVASGPDTDAIKRYWRRVLPVRLPSRLTSAIIDAVVPQPPAEPTPEDVLAFARLHTLVSDTTGEACLALRRPDQAQRVDVLYDGLLEAYELVSADLAAQRHPCGGAALDSFVSAHARSLDRQDTRAFRRQLSGLLAQAAAPVTDRYWALVGELAASARSSVPAEPTLGAAHEWLRAALDAQLADCP